MAIESFPIGDTNLNSAVWAGWFSKLRTYLLTVSGNTTLAYSATITTDARMSQAFLITPTNVIAFTIALPINPTIGQLIEYTIKNTTGAALGALTFNAVFKLGAAWVQPATGFSRAIGFRFNGTNWVEKYRTAADVAN